MADRLDRPLIPDGTTVAGVLPSLGWLLPRESAPYRFMRLLGEVVPDWRIEPPEMDASDLHVSAVSPDESRRVVAITVDWQPADGYRDHDEWAVTGHGPHPVETVMQLSHGAGRAEFDAVLRILRAVWAE